MSTGFDNPGAMNIANIAAMVIRSRTGTLPLENKGKITINAAERTKTRNQVKKLSIRQVVKYLAGFQEGLLSGLNILLDHFRNLTYHSDREVHKCPYQPRKNHKQKRNNS